ncbi:MAG: hypothetical protein WCM76_01190 [Bacteroidota bacterium]
MKTNSKITRNFTSTFATVTAMFVLVFAVAFTNTATSQNDNIPSENATTVNNSEYNTAVNYDLLAVEKNALSPVYMVTLSNDGMYYIMSTKTGNSTNYRVGYIGQLSAPKIASNNIENEVNYDMALGTNNNDSNAP